MWLVVGLGNPGPRYAGTRHNIGFMVVDRLAERARAPAFSSKYKGELASCRLGGDQALLLKPLTYMNVSGDSVQPAMAFYKLAPEHLIVIHDDLDLELGQLKLKKGGGHGGHNGIRHISQRIGPDFIRIRAGIGRPKGQKSVSSHVLGGFSAEEAELAEILVEKTADAVECVISDGLVTAQNRYQEKKKKKQKKPKPPPKEKAEGDDGGGEAKGAAEG